MAVVPDVDANGNPETPANQVAEKQKQKHMATIGLVIGGAGLALVLFLRNKGNSNGGSQTATSAGTTGGLGAGDVYSPGGAGSGFATGAYSAGETSILSQQQQNQSQLSAQNLGLAEQQQDIGVELQNTNENVANLMAVLQGGPGAKLPYQGGQPLPYKQFVPAPTTTMTTQNPFYGSASGA